MRDKGENQDAINLLAALIRSGYAIECYDLSICPDHDNKTVILSTHTKPVTADSPRRNKEPRS